MATIRKTASIENGIMQVLKILNDDEILEAIKEIYEGIELAAKNYGVDVIGGDTTATPYGLVISITAIGEANKKVPLVLDMDNENQIVFCSY